MTRLLVYSGDVGALQRELGHVYDVQAVSAESLACDPWPGTTYAVVLGAHANADATRRIVAYVERGGLCVAHGPVAHIDTRGTHAVGRGCIIVADDAASVLKSHLGPVPAPAELTLTPLYVDGDTGRTAELVGGDSVARFDDSHGSYYIALPAGVQLALERDPSVPLVALQPAPEDARFSVAAYRAALDLARREVRVPWTASVWGSDVRLCDTLGYAAVTTSTQTVMESTRLQNTLPDGTTFLASQQAAGRGRGNNRWISPLGCLQFSTLWRQPLAMAPRMLFVQYLAAISMAVGLEHAFGEPARGRIRIKWPNDVYIEASNGSVVRTIDGERRRYAKIGGVLVNAATREHELCMVIGCGINCLNAEPMQSVATAVGTDTLPSMETCAACVHAALESALGAFSSHGGDFGVFSDAYRSLWLNACVFADSDDQVTLADTGEQVRIVGVTRDFGLLRTVPLSYPITSRNVVAWGPSGSVESIDLQPDGNTFDMLQNMVRSR